MDSMIILIESGFKAIDSSVTVLSY